MKPFRFLSFFLLILAASSCNDSLKQEINDLRAELNKQRSMLEALAQSDAIIDIDEKEDGYILYLTSGKTLRVKNGKTALVSINAEGNWTIDGADTGVSAQAAHIEIGGNGHWMVDGVDTGIDASGKEGPGAPEITLIVSGPEQFIFCFSDGSELSVQRLGIPVTHQGKNLLNPLRVTISNPVYGFIRSDYIPIREGESLTASSNYSMWQTKVLFYDKYGNELPEARYEETGMEVTSITVSAFPGAHYVRFEFREAEGLNQIERGPKATDYERFIHGNETLKTLVLPDTLLLLSGKEIALYTDNIITKSSFEYHGLASEGLPILKDRIRINHPVSEATPFVFRLYKGDQVDQAGTRYFQFLDPSQRKKDVERILFIGDSFTDMGSYIEQTVKKMKALGIDLQLLGTHNSHPARKSEGLSGGALQQFIGSPAGKGAIVRIRKGPIPESTYGSAEYVDENNVSWTVQGTFTDREGNAYIRLGIWVWDRRDIPEVSIPSAGVLRCKNDLEDESLAIEFDHGKDCYFNPFWNTRDEGPDFLYYLENTFQEKPGIVVFQFTWNDLPPYATRKECARFAENMDRYCSILHQQLPDTKILVSIEPAGAINSARGASFVDGHHFTRLSCFAEFQKIFAGSSYVTIVPTYAFVDRVNAFDGSDYVTDDIHPNALGVEQIADAFVPYILDALR